MDILFQKMNIYRFQFSEDITHSILCFSKLHEFEDRKDYQEYWKKWCEENEEMIRLEQERLERLGYQGDMMEKMYRSSRYYFRKKKMEKSVPKERDTYVSISKERLKTIDSFIRENLFLNIKPKDLFIQFLEYYSEWVSEIQEEYIQKGISDKEIIIEKIKKTFKNRYFNITHNQ